MEVMYKRFKLRLFDDLCRMNPNTDSVKINQIIKEVVNAPDFSLSTVQNYYKFCIQCGVCCNGCEALNEDGYCTHHETKPDICKTFPYWSCDGEHGVYVNDYCAYIYKLFLYEINKMIR